MNVGLIGRKVSMTQLFMGTGEVLSATVIEAGPCMVIQKKTSEKDGYEAVQLGFGEWGRNVSKPWLGHFGKCKSEPRKIVREFRLDSADEYQAGQEIRVDIFNPEDFVDVIGTSKGKGFMGTMKRWGFTGGPGSHGAHKWNRRPGSIGASSDPSRVFRGTKMAGHTGNRRTSVQNLKVLKVDKEKNLLFVKGAVPGPNGGYLIVKRAKKKTGEAGS